MAPRSYQKLEVWRDGIGLVRDVHAMTRSRPGDERFGLISQIRRAVVSVPSSVAEGWGRYKKGELDQFLRYARGSPFEVDTRLVIASEPRTVPKPAADALRHRADVLGRRILALRRSL